jgi:hypothetical protein
MYKWQVPVSTLNNSKELSSLDPIKGLILHKVQLKSYPEGGSRTPAHKG